MIIIKEKVVNKSNSNEIRINPSLWSEIRGMVEGWRKRNPTLRPWWIGPNSEAMTFQEIVAWSVKLQNKRKFGKADVAISINLVNQNIDCDGIKAVIDGIQDSGVIENDRQVKNLSIVSVKREGEKPSLEIDIRLIVEK